MDEMLDYQYENGMDLKEQLVIWKRAGYLLDNIALTPKLSAQLVDEGIFTMEMMKKIMRKQYNTERLLLLLSMLGTYGDRTFERFLRALDITDHHRVVKELQKTEKYTHFGEMLPPQFTYFLDMSEFLKLYPHIGLKLGEEGKHILQTFIEGKLLIEHRKWKERIETLEREKAALILEVKRLKELIREMEMKMAELEAIHKTSDDQINSLKNTIAELEELAKDLRMQIRALKHYHRQQSDLDNFLHDELKEFTNSKSFVKTTERDPVEVAENTEPTKEVAVEKLRVFLLHSEVNLKSIEIDVLNATCRSIEGEERRVIEYIKNLQHEKDLGIMDDETAEEVNNIEKLRNDLTLSRKQTQKLIHEKDRELTSKERELSLREKECSSTMPKSEKVKSYADLVVKLKALLENMRRLHTRKTKELCDKHDQEIEDIIKRINEMNQKHADDIAHYKMRVKQKMIEIHKREQLHKRLRNQITVIMRYHAKNMNATVSVEQCRKIVRSIIGDARKLKKIADEKDQEKDLHTLILEQQQKELEEKQQREGDGKKKKKKKRRRIGNSLSDEKLSYLADQLGIEWRHVGLALDLTNNNMDMVEMDCETKLEIPAFGMLKTWRDQENGKTLQLLGVLLDLDKDELAMAMSPNKKMLQTAKVQKEKREKKEKEEEIADNELLRMIAEDDENRNSDVPTLPPINEGGELVTEGKEAGKEGAEN